MYFLVTTSLKTCFSTVCTKWFIFHKINHKLILSMKLVNWFWTKKYISIFYFPVLVICQEHFLIERFSNVSKLWSDSYYRSFISSFRSVSIQFTPSVQVLIDRPKGEKEVKLSKCSIRIKWKIINTNNSCFFLAGLCW